jgi:cation:H+ antiporter
MTMTSLVITVLISALAIVGAGTLLARAGDVMAARTKWGGVWVGSVFLAAATSLPEIVTDISAVRLGAPDLAAGDLFGSSMANMVILAVVTVIPAGTQLFQKATLDHALYASLAIVLTATAAMSVLVGGGPSLLGVSGSSWLLLAMYIAGSRVVFRHSALARHAAETIEMSGGLPAAPPGEAPQPASTASLRRALVMFAGGAVVLVVAAPAFARSAQGIAEATGLGATFIGTWLVGFSTSLPELVTSLAAVRMRAYDLAVGNLFGSNAFNMAVFPLLDAVSPAGPIFGLITATHAISALVAIGLMAIALAALVYRARGRLSLLEPSSALILVGYVLGLALVLMNRTH